MGHPSKLAVAIIGMHRSGTSSLAGSLQQAGLAMGEVVQWAPHNLKGNRENLEIRQLNDEVLSISGGSWDNPPSKIVWNDAQAARRDTIISAFESIPGNSWGFKDPRTTITLPFWQEGAPDLQLVLTFRHPLAVAKSLATRDKMPIEQGINLWRLYNQRLLSYAHGFDSPMLCFDVPKEEYLSALRGVICCLGLTPHGQQALFFDETLRRHSCTDGAVAVNLSPTVMTIYEELKNCYRKFFSSHATDS